MSKTKKGSNTLDASDKRCQEMFQNRELNMEKEGEEEVN